MGWRMNLWQAGADVMVGPGLTTDPATIKEVKAAMEAAGYDVSEIEEVDGPYVPLFLIPLKPEQERELTEKGSLMFSLEIPEEARDKDVPKPEFASHVTFNLEMP